jgi:hypothetical protein
VKLYRAMTSATDGLPKLGRSARSLGIRTPLEVTNSQPDVTAVDPDEIIQPGTGGMSVAPGDPGNLPILRRPLLLGGTGKDPAWEIESGDLGPDLQYTQDSSTHGLIEPTQPMTLKDYEQALAATRAKWVRHTG